MTATGAPVPPWRMSGELLSACNCDWGCPCNFDAPPTYGHCDGFYVLTVKDGSYGDDTLDGVTFIMGGHSPGPIHQGGGTDLLILDASASEDQRLAIETLWRGGGVGSPFDEFASVAEVRLEPVSAEIKVALDGIRSKVEVTGDASFELALARVANPVTGEEEELYLDKPTGFTSTRSELGMSTVGRFRSPSFSVDVSGKYAEHAGFSYAGP